MGGAWELIFRFGWPQPFGRQPNHLHPVDSLTSADSAIPLLEGNYFLDRGGQPHKHPATVHKSAWAEHTGITIFTKHEKI